MAHQPPDQPSDILGKLGISTATLDRVRLARGVVGNTTYVACAAVLAMAAVGWAFSGHPTIALTLIAIIAVFSGFYLLGTWLFAHKHPDLALLGGAELLQLRQMEMGIKGMPALTDTQGTTPPLLINRAED